MVFVDFRQSFIVVVLPQAIESVTERQFSVKIAQQLYKNEKRSSGTVKGGPVDRATSPPLTEAQELLKRIQLCIEK